VVRDKNRPMPMMFILLLAAMQPHTGSGSQKFNHKDDKNKNQ